MALVRTFINRGKRPMEVSELKPNYVYAVRHILPAEVATEWGITQQEVWGIIQLGANKEVRRSWNVVTPGTWSVDDVKVTGLAVFKASLMEQQFAFASENEFAYTTKCQQLAIRNSDLQRSVDYFKTNRWHKLAERIANLF